MNREGQPGHIDHIKQINTGAVYRLIDQYGPISRIDLSKVSQLAPASITKIVRELFDAHLVKETEFNEVGSRGRPAVGVELDTQAWHYLTGRIHYGYLTLALRDLSNQVIIEEQIDFPIDHSASWLERFIAQIESFFNRHQKQLERLTAIAITLPGIVDATSGIVHKMPFYNQENVPLGPMLSQRTGLPVYVQHDVSAWAISEALYGAAVGCQNVIQLVIDDIVGASVITDGRVLHADSGSHIEIGHTQVDPNGKACYCGNHGCLETIASMGSILEQTQQRLNTHPESALHHAPLTIENLCNAANEGDQLATEIIQHVGHSVGQIAAVMVNIFNPEKIIIGSPLNRSSAILYPAIENSVRQQSLPQYSTNIRLAPTHFINQGTMPGAALVKMALYNGALLVKLLQG
ncbi:sugar metabolism global transcriptional regulator Mlc [Pragia fontium]|uniref:Transcriptional regulator of PTS protein n=2 Tax=Pragia fontium TaxID=82985 RepID=A0AAJ5BHG3_9GAMM|nr:ROK family transcriptional regulator [Pragia fontium]AKJ42279.1 transcriptional regulator [Pragia fontium]SFC94963.1 transcriptional regulator of PTS gene [Pragia fontium DSM 5563 = ATCC 49100]SUB82554.1 Making large colonies protein [Pragia fontium]VEJ55453.1 Making large colonies protein [Pragia fontium]GKX61651.1 transcriptional regulator [Pragia fontium]